MRSRANPLNPLNAEEAEEPVQYDEAGQPVRRTLRPVEAGCIMLVVILFMLFCAYLYLAFFGHARQ